MRRSGDRSSPARSAVPAAALALLLLAGCTTAGGALSNAERDGWRVVERSGEAQVAPQRGTRAVEVGSGDVLPAAATVVTGPGSRLLLARDDDQISVGPLSRLVLPEPGRGALLEQDAGTVLYRIGGEAGAPFRIATPTGRTESTGGMFRVDVDRDLIRSGYEVTAGALRIATPDGSRGVTIRAGQSAETRAGDGQSLAFSRGSGEPLEPVAPVLAATLAEIPPAASATRAEVEAASPSSPSSARSEVQARHPAPIPRPRPALVAGAVPSGPARPAATADGPAPVERIILPAGYASRAAPAVTGRTPEGAADPAGEGASGDAFDRMTQGLLEGLGRETRVAPRPDAR